VPELKQTRTKPWRARIFWAHQHHLRRVWITQGGIEEVQRSFQKLTRRMSPDNLSLETRFKLNVLGIATSEPSQ